MHESGPLSTCTIAVTGGHLTPAQAFIEYVLEQQAHQPSKTNYDFIFFGREFSQSENIQKAREAIEIGKLNVPFINIEVPKFVKRNPLALATDTLLYPVALVKAFALVAQHRPNVIVTFGSYLAVPIAVAGWLLRIPIITHEQTVVGGSANQFIARLAKYVALSFPQSKKYFPTAKTKVTGNPIRSILLKPTKVRPSWITQTPDKPILFVAGGNQGSYFINTTIGHILPQLTRKYTIIHACGSSTTQLDYQQELQSIRQKLSANQRQNYYIREWVGESDLAWVLQHAALAVSRAGANTVQELISNQVPAIFIPLPFAKNDEQQRNAQLVAKTGGAVVASQNSLTPELLLETINKKMAVHKSLKAKLAKLSLPTDGAAKLFELVASICKPS